MKTFDYAIDGIFPVPVYYSFDVKKFTKAELTAVNNHKKKFKILSIDDLNESIEIFKNNKNNNDNNTDLYNFYS